MEHQKLPNYPEMTKIPLNESKKKKEKKAQDISLVSYEFKIAPSWVRIIKKKISLAGNISSRTLSWVKNHLEKFHSKLKNPETTKKIPMHAWKVPQVTFPPKMTTTIIIVHISFKNWIRRHKSPEHFGPKVKTIELEYISSWNRTCTSELRRKPFRMEEIGTEERAI